MNLSAETRKEMYGLQPAGLWQRISAVLLDFICFSVLAIGFAFLISWIAGFDEKEEKFESMLQEIENSAENAREELKKKAEEFYFQYIFPFLVMEISLGIFFAILIVDFLVPLAFQNGETLGKRCFGICVVKSSGVKVKAFTMFVRSILGKYTVEIMVPLSAIMLSIVKGKLFLLISGGIILANFVSFLFTRKRTAIHDALADTVVVDKKTQMIFESEKELEDFRETFKEKRKAFSERDKQ